MTSVTTKAKKVKIMKEEEKKTKQEFKSEDYIRCEISEKEVLGMIYLSEYSNLKIYYILHNSKEVRTGNVPLFLDVEKDKSLKAFKKAWKISDTDGEIDFDKYEVKKAEKMGNKVGKITNGESLVVYGLI